MSSVFTESKIHVQNTNNNVHFLLKQWNIQVNYKGIIIIKRSSIFDHKTTLTSVLIQILLYHMCQKY